MSDAEIHTAIARNWVVNIPWYAWAVDGKQKLAISIING